MKFKFLLLFSIISVMLYGQSKTSVGLNVTYPLLDNKNNMLVNSVERTSLYEEVQYFEKPGISLLATHEMPFFFETFFSFGLGLDWLNYRMEFYETDIISQNKYKRSSYNPLIERYNATNPSFSTTVLFASIPVNIKYAIIRDMSVCAGFITNIQLANNQEVNYKEYDYSNNRTLVEEKTIDTDDGINNLVFLINVGCEYSLSKELAITFNYKIGLTPLYNSNYTFVENSALNLFNLGVSYCFLK